jgi:hypothetical protein
LQQDCTGQDGGEPGERREPVARSESTGNALLNNGGAHRDAVGVLSCPSCFAGNGHSQLIDLAPERSHTS